MNPWPLKWKLSILTFLVLTTVIIVLSTVAYVEMEEALVKNIDQTLKAMGEGVLAVLDDNENLNEIRTEIQSITGAVNRGGRIRYRIWRQDGQVDIAVYDPDISDTGSMLNTHMPVQPPAVGQYKFFDMPASRYRAFWIRHGSNDKIINIIIADSNSYTHHEMEEYLTMLLILGGSVVAGSVIVILLIVSWALHPIEQTAATLRTVTHANLGDEHLKDLRAPRELSPFVDSVKEMLYRLNQAMQKQKQFTGDASHELRTPLALAKSTLQTVRRNDHAKQDYIRAIDETLNDIDRIEKLSNQLLELARLDSTAIHTAMPKVELNTILEMAVTDYESFAKADNKMTVYERTADIWIQGREELLRRLFANLLDNAIKYGPSGKSIRVYFQDISPKTVTVCIHDEGGAIPSEVLPRLFDRFYRPDSSRSSTTGGNGLGLAIAYEIVQLHKGTIEIHSSASTGTDVIVQFPRIS